jgi:hypothetical protein
MDKHDHLPAAASLGRGSDRDPQSPPPRYDELADEGRIRAIADSLDCILDSDFCALAQVRPGTSESWRKRGVGPPYIRLGNRYLYPREGLMRHLQLLVRERASIPARALL